MTIDEQFQHEVPQLMPLPAIRFEAGQIRTTVVSPRSWVSIATNHYSVPVEWVGHEVTIRVDAEGVVIHRRRGETVIHRRSYGKSHAVVEIDHYLPLLKRKCRGLDRSVVFRRWIEKARPAWVSYLKALRFRFGEVRGTREFVDTLFLTRTWDEEAVTRAVERTLEGESVSLPVVRYFLRDSVADAGEAAATFEYAGPEVDDQSAAAYMTLCREVHDG